MANSMDASESAVSAHLKLSPGSTPKTARQMPPPTVKTLCVDLDGTLLKTDILVEGMLSILSRRGGFVEIIGLATPRRAALKSKVAALAQTSPELLPYNTEFIAFLRDRREAGQQIVLTTAADAGAARIIAEHFGIFDQVIASDGENNLKGEKKARELVRRFGPKGFDYAGNDRADFAVWREADGIIVVNASRAVTRGASTLGNVIREFPRQSPLLAAALRAMRPHQWVKNLLLFVPLLTSRAFTDWPGLFSTLLAFVAFCLAASSVYLVNDLLDLNADRAHPRKRERPLARGDLPLQFAAGLSGLLLASGFALAMLAGIAHLVLLYVAASLSYSLWFKQYPLLDVFVLASLYTLRIVAGGVASHHPVTLWLMAFSGFTFLSLALVKRCGELRGFDEYRVVRRGYYPGDRPVLVMFGVGSVFASSVVLALFIGSAAAVQPYKSPEMLWGLVPLCLFWQCRLWLSTERGHMHDDPIVYAFRDRVSWMVAAAAVAIVVLATWFPFLT